MKRLLLFILFLFANGLLYAQDDFRFRHLSVSDGLSQNTVTCMLQDRSGFVWIGTQDGLNRFDGYKFTVFRHRPEDPESITDDFIICSAEDQAGNLWFGTRHGLNVYNPARGKFLNIFLSEGDKEEFHKSISGISVDSEGNVWISGSGKQLMVSKKETEHLKEEKKIPEMKPPAMTVMFLHIPSSGKKVWFRDGSRFYGFTSPGNKMEFEFPLDENCAVSYILEEKRNVWIGTTKGLFCFDQELQKSETVVRDISVNALYVDEKGILWVAASSGIYLVDRSAREKQLSHITQVAEDTRSLSANDVNCFLKDNSGILFIGTNAGGLDIYDPAQSVFKNLNAMPNRALHLSNNLVWSVFQDRENRLWAGSSNGLNKISFADQEVSLETFSFPEKTIRKIDYYFLKDFGLKLKPGEVQNSPGSFFSFITQEKDGTLWFGTKYGLISSGEDGNVKIYRNDPANESSISNDRVLHLVIDSKQNLWVSTLAGLNLFRKSTGTFKRFINNSNDPESLSANYVISTYEDKRGNIWVCTTFGLNKLKASGNGFSRYRNRSGDLKSLSYNSVTCCYEDSKNRFWVGTLGGGLCLMDREKETFEAFDNRFGLANGVIYGILEDKDGKLWMSTNSGISKFDPEEKYFINYDADDGLTSNEFSQNAYFRNKEGEFFWGSPEGLLFFNPAEVKEKAESKRTIVSSFKINYKDVSPERFFGLNELSLRPNERTISLEFLSPDFRNTEKIEYSYILEGFDNTWITLPAGNRVATYTNLPFGDFTFKVRTRKNSPKWNETSLSLVLKVLPPFWLTWWFIVLEVFTVLALVVVVVKYYSQRKLKIQLREIELQHKIHLERERISRDLHDNVGAQMTYIISTLDFLNFKSEKKSEEENSSILTELASYTRNTISQLRETIWAINKESFTMEEFIQKTQNYVSHALSNSSISHSVFSKGVFSARLKPFQALNLYRIIQEAVSNALKHSGANSISVELSNVYDHRISLLIKDDGKGFETGDGTKTDGHYGLTNMKERVTELHGEFSIHSSPGSGTEIRISVPV